MVPETSDVNVTHIEGQVQVGLVNRPIDDGAIRNWVARPSCGAVVVFYGTARDHSAGRPGVEMLEYEAYTKPALCRLQAVANEALRRWPAVERLAVVHRLGKVQLQQAAVVVAAAAPHRPESFAAASFAIEAVKATVPLWKRETWSEGTSWGLNAEEIEDISEM